MDEFDERRQVSFSGALENLPGRAGERYRSLFRHGSLEVEIYAPRAEDLQTPHERDEVYVVVRGRGTYQCGDERHSFGPGDFLFAPAGAEHRFVDFTDELAVWVLFYGPQGGERP